MTTGTLATRTDAKNQRAVYTYDAYQELTQVSDAKMISFFYRHESSFERLVTMAREDAGIHAVTRDSVMLKSGENNWIVTSPHAIPQQRWDEYQRLFKELSLPVGFAQDEQDIDFRFDNYSFFNGDSCKGFTYSLKPLPTCTTELSRCLSAKGIGSKGDFGQQTHQAALVSVFVLQLTQQESWADSTGLDYAVNRYYASTIGRFMTTDPNN